MAYTQPSFWDEVTGNIDFNSQYEDLANEVTSKLELGRQAGINQALTATGQNKEVIDEAAAHTSQQGIMGPVATAIGARTQARLAGNTASKLAGNEVATGNKENMVQQQSGLSQIKMRQQQDLSNQEMIGNIFTGIGQIAGQVAGTSGGPAAKNDVSVEDQAPTQAAADTSAHSAADTSALSAADTSAHSAYEELQVHAPPHTYGPQNF